eukprot:774820-Karenia_brevis.AAC.1
MAQDDPCGPETALLYPSLLGGVAWATQTRPDILVFVGYCQQWMRNHHSGYTYHSLELPTCLAVISDSAFKAQDPDCLSVRGSFICLAKDKPNQLGGRIQPRQATSTKQP